MEAYPIPLTAEFVQALLRVTPDNKSFFLYEGGQLYGLFQSEGLAPLLGYEEKEFASLVKANALSFVDPRDQPRFVAVVERCLASQKQALTYARLLKKDGTPFYVQGKINYVGIYEGKPSFLVTYCGVLNENDIYKSVLDNTKRRVLIVSAATREILYVNAAVQERDGPAIGRTCYAWDQGRREACPDCPLNKIKNLGDSLSYDRYHNRLKIYERITAKKILWCDQEAYIVYADDISDIVSHQQELEDLLEANRSQYAAIAVLNGSEPFESKIKKALHLLLDYFEADRVYTMRFDENYQYIRNTFEEVKAGVSPQISSLQNVPSTNAPRWLEAFKKGEPIAEGDVERIKTLYPPEYAIMKQQDIHSYVEVPVRSGGRLVGFVGIDNPASKKLSFSKNLLLAFAYGLGSVLEQKESEKALQQSRDLYETATKLADIAVWVYDIKAKRIIISDSEVAREEGQRYGIPRVIENAPEAIERFIDPVDLPKIREAYAAVQRGEPKVVCDYWYKTPVGVRRHRERMVYTTLYDDQGAPSSAIGIGLDITSDTLQRENYDRSMESLLRSNPQAVESFHFDLSENKVLESHFSSAASKKLLQHDSVDGFFAGVASLITDPAKQAEYRDRTSRGRLVASFSQGLNSFSLSYRRKTVEGLTRDVNAYFTLLENPSNHHIECFLYAEDISEQKRKEEIFRYVADEQCDAVTLLHLKEKTFEVFAVSPRLLSPGHSIASVLGRSLPYEEKNRANILSWIDPDKRAYYASITSLEAITKALSEKSPYEINILGHSSANPHEVTCRRLQYSYLDSGKNDVLLIQTDVTTTYLQQEKEAERAKEEAKRVTDILDSVSNGIVVFHMDDETHLEGDFVNLQMFRFLGLPAEKEADRERFMRNPMIQAYLANAFLAVDPSDKARVEASFAKGYHTDRFSVERYKITKQDGSKAYVTTDLILKEKQGARHIYYASYRLVDQEVKLQNEVAHQLQKEKKLRLAADSANRAKSDFLSRMSHDMRTPLNGIIGMSYLAQEEKNPPRTRECLQKIDNSSKFLLGLINDVLDMSKAESGTIELHPEPYGSEAFLQYLDSVIVPLCHEKNIRFVVDAKPLKEEVPLLDTLRINQVFFNLLSNSVKFTPEGGTITYKLREKLNPGEKTMRLSAEVRDTGVGMSEEFLSHLFEPFTQEGRIDNMENRGTGLGLAIVKKMLDLMGCSISVHSAIGLGTSFIVEGDFPFVAAEQKPEPPALTLSGEDFSALKNKHILLAEDHPLNQEIARTLLEEKGMVVAIAEDGKLAYEAFKNSSRGYYDAILMDIRMPVMDGYAATEEIRLLKRPDAKKVPIIALTADAFADDVKKCLAVGMNAHLAKPLEPQKLYATLLREIGPKKK